ncbi:hypothetical protein N9H17_05715 [Schleiferiaceae bacterium]|nr:hypothetical protein [Schleiferiaceae bacterium]
MFYQDHIDTLPNYTINYENIDFELSASGHLHFSSGDLLAVFGGTGMVLKVDTVLQAISRVDETYHHGYNYDAYSFVRADTLFSYGGYGFWMRNSLLTFYSNLRKEWSLYSVAPIDIEVPLYSPRDDEHDYYSSIDDRLYVMRDGILYSYDFKGKAWSNLGEVNLELMPGRISMTHGLTDSTLLIMSSEFTIWVCPFRNEYADISMPNGVNLAQKDFDDGFNCAYDIGEMLVLPKSSDKVKSKVIFESVKSQIPPMSERLTLYRSPKTNSTILTLFFFFFGISGIVLTFVLRKNYLRSRGAIFDTVEWQILERVSNGPLNTDDINELLGIETVSWEVQRRKRSEFIKQLNETSKKQLGEEVLLRERSEQDKRQVLYVLNPLLESALARLL